MSRPADRGLARDGHFAPDSILALEDGSLWYGRRQGGADLITGPVELDADRVIVGGKAALALPAEEMAGLGAHLDRCAHGGGAVHGCVAAPKATAPIHVAVARAIARGEIGRP